MTAEFRNSKRSQMRSATFNTMFVFGVFGPPIGAIVLPLLMFFESSIRMYNNDYSQPPFYLQQSVIESLPLAILLSYPFGLLQAVGTGALASLVQWSRDFKSSTRFRVISLVAAVVVGLPLAIILFYRSFSLFFIYSVHVVPAGLCYWISSRFWYKARYE